MKIILIHDFALNSGSNPKISPKNHIIYAKILVAVVSVLHYTVLQYSTSTTHVPGHFWIVFN